MSISVTNPRRPALTTVLSGILAITTLTVLDGYLPGAMRRFDAAVLDFLVSHEPSKPTGKVAIAAIDDSSIDRLGSWSWPHSLQARLVDALIDYKVSVIGFDVWFVNRQADDPGDTTIRGGADASKINDDLLRKAVIKHGATYLGYLFHNPSSRSSRPDPSLFTTSLVEPRPLTYDVVIKTSGDARLDSSLTRTYYGPPLQVLNSAVSRHTAFLDVDLDPDGIVRSFPTVLFFRGLYCAPLFLALADAKMYRAPLRLNLADRRIMGIVLANRTIPVDEMGRMVVRFRGPQGTIPRYSVVDIIEHKIKASALSGKIVLVGVTAEGVGDRFATPVGSNFPGVEIQATAVDNVLSGGFLYRSRRTEHTERIVGWILAGMVTLSAVLLTALGSFLLSIVFLVTSLLYCKSRMAADGALIGFGFPTIAALMTYASVATTSWRTSTKQKKYTRWIADHYLNPKVFAQSEISGENPGIEEDASIMFADLSGFTQRSQDMGPKVLTDKVNRYFGQIVLPVDETNGRIERFLGDAMLAFWTDGSSDNDNATSTNELIASTIRFLGRKWKAPLVHSNHAVRAIRAAIAIVEKVRLQKQADQAHNEPGFTIKIGINSGRALIGNVGSGRHFSFSLMGKEVNFAARLESVPPLYGCNVVVGENVALLARDKFLLRELDWILVKDARTPMTIYEPIAELDHADDAKRELLASFARALEYYRAGRFADACALWEELVVRYEPAPSPSSIMASRARDFMTQAPAPPWAAINVLKSK